MTGELSASDIEATQPYVDRVHLFLSGQRAAEDFVVDFFDFMKSDPTQPSPDAYEAWQTLFHAVEAYVDDPDLRDPAEGDIDEDQLRAAAEQFLVDVRRLGLDRS